jgi:hypothetical protein
VTDEGAVFGGTVGTYGNRHQFVKYLSEVRSLGRLSRSFGYNIKMVIDEKIVKKLCIQLCQIWSSGYLL